VGPQVYGLTTAQLGVYFGAPAAGYFLGNWISGAFSARLGINKMVLWGCWLNGIGVAISAGLTLAGFGTVYTFFGFMTIVGIGNGMAIPNATSGALSVRPHLAATASGLSGAIMLGGGAALSALAGALLTPGSGSMPLLVIMLLTAVAGIASIQLVIRRERALGL
jgi:DHA1 family bicyclomycin/chloramphenicol resistance-like MFS transporter